MAAICVATANLHPLLAKERCRLWWLGLHIQSTIVHGKCSNDGMAEIGVAVGTGVLALATFVLAAMAYWNVRKTGGLVTATEKSAAAAKATIDEIQRDRELAYRPYLSWRVGGLSSNPKDIKGGTAWVANFGRGPAIHCLCCTGLATPAATTVTTDLFDLSPNEPEPRRLDMTLRSGAQLTSEMAGTEVGEEPVRAAFCQDQLGNYYRFVPFKVETDVFRPGTDKAEPRWMVFYRDQFTLLAKDRPASPPFVG